MNLCIADVHELTEKAKVPVRLIKMHIIKLT